MCKALSIALAYIKCENVLLITTGIDGDNGGKDNKDLGPESVSCINTNTDVFLLLCPPGQT